MLLRAAALDVPYKERKPKINVFYALGKQLMLNLPQWLLKFSLKESL